MCGVMFVANWEVAQSMQTNNTPSLLLDFQRSGGSCFNCVGQGCRRFGLSWFVWLYGSVFHNFDKQLDNAVDIHTYISLQQTWQAQYTLLCSRHGGGYIYIYICSFIYRYIYTYIPLGRSLKSSRAWASVSTHLKISEDQCAVSTAGIITQAIKK